MKQKWGREEYAGDWPSGKAVWTIGAVFVGLIAAGAICAYRYARSWTPLERNYLTAYLATDAGAMRKDGWYTLLMVETRKGPAQKQRLKEELIAGRWSTEIMLGEG
jgi:hypothetical protein